MRLIRGNFHGQVLVLVGLVSILADGLFKKY
jgi:hypothetical protein